MGIPAFYRWLVERYPLSVAKVIEEAPTVVNGVDIPIDTSKPNPNEIEFDNLYLDMNGIIHPCFHPEDMPPPSCYDDVYKAVFAYLDHVFSIVRPRKLLFMAIDGVAPRAKMNQQRARRFRAAKDSADAAVETVNSKDTFEKLGSNENSNKKLDSNVITPGTEFMASLSNALQNYIQIKLNTDPGWKGIKVILSDSNVPGEGEHKVASYIRLQRNLPGFDPNTRHCLYGLDADLIMLGLATHEIYFSILREDVTAMLNDRRQNFSNKNNSNHKKPAKNEASNKKNLDAIQKIQFQFMHIWILREYLELEMKIRESPVKIELDRIIDDFVFICLFVGNDFLPHIPSLAINEGALDLLVNVYKKEFSKMGGYLTTSFEVDLGRVEHFLQVVATHEPAIFRRRLQVNHEKDLRFGSDIPAELSTGNSWMSGIEETKIPSDSNNSSRKEALNKNKVATIEEGWKERYYNDKFEVETAEERTKVKNDTVLKYVEGICWFMHYYYQGVCSWNWYYPYHYAPFASDFIDLKNLEIKFDLGEPFKPFDQLMGVLPSASAHALPTHYRNLMTDPNSSIVDFYPQDFEIDLNGKRFSWQAICKLPFIDESRLLEQIQNVEPTLTDEERKRNSCALSALYFHASHGLAPKVISFYKKRQNHPKLNQLKLKRTLNPKFSGGMNGTVYISEKTVQSSELNSQIEGIKSIKNNQTIFVYYKFPQQHKHITRIPEGAIIPQKIITRKKLVRLPNQLWHERTAVQRHFHSNGPVRNSIGGNNLSRFSHQLVSTYYNGNKQNQNQNQNQNSNRNQNQNQSGVKKDENLGKRKRNVENSKERKTKESNSTIDVNAPIANTEPEVASRTRHKKNKGNKKKV